MRRHLQLVGPIAAYMGLIFLLSSQAHLPVPALPAIDKVAHFLEYAFLGVLVMRAAQGYGAGKGRGVALSLAICTIYAASDELHQAYTPNRASELSDFLADSAGATLGVAAWYAARGRTVASRSS